MNKNEVQAYFIEIGRLSIAGEGSDVYDKQYEYNDNNTAYELDKKSAFDNAMYEMMSIGNDYCIISSTTLDKELLDDKDFLENECGGVDGIPTDGETYLPENVIFSAKRAGYNVDFNFIQGQQVDETLLQYAKDYMKERFDVDYDR